MTKRVLVLLLGIAVSLSAMAQEVPNLDWTQGMYWSYQTDALASSTSIRTQGTLTFLVLAGDGCLTSQTWYLAAITQWCDGTEIMITTSHSDSLALSSWRRWPQIANYIPPKHLPDSRLQFRQTVASERLPWFEDETSMRIETAWADGWAESISLAERGSEWIRLSIPSRMLYACSTPGIAASGLPK